MNFDETTMFLGGNTIVGKRYHTIHTCSRKVLKNLSKKNKYFLSTKYSIHEVSCIPFEYFVSIKHKSSNFGLFSNQSLKSTYKIQTPA